MDDPKSQLDDIVSQGVVLDLYHAEEVLSLGALMGREAARINEATFGAFFGSLQIIFGRFLILSVARMFEQPGHRYQIRSIPAALGVLREHCGSLSLQDRAAVVKSLCRQGAPETDVKALPDHELTRFVADFFGRRLSASYQEGGDNAQALQALKTLRDKNIAHPEAIRPEDLPKATFAQIDELVALARAFVGAVGIGYLNVAYEDDKGNYMMSRDAERSTLCLNRLLQKAGVVPPRNL
jgi:hypothetical protein